MRLIPADNWIREVFEEPRPALGRVMIWIEKGEVPGRVIDGEAWVDAERFALGQKVEVEEITGADLLA